jgi:FkbM family methyltransferase
MNFTSYAQNFEDVYIWRAFRDDTPFGFYIDVGAYDPVEDSVTQFLYEQGWSGINVEPGPSIDRFAVRTRDLNLSLAVTDETGFSQFYLHPGDPGTSTMLPQVAPELESLVGERVGSRVATVTLHELLDRYAPGRHVHVLKLDIEGMEGPVIAATDWQRHRPELVLVEVTRPYTNERRDDLMLRPLLEARYEEVFFDGVNAYLLREESLFRRAAFSRPVNVLDGFRKHDSEREKLKALLIAAEQERDALAAKLHAGALRAKEEEDALRARLEAELSAERERAATDRAALAARSDTELRAERERAEKAEKARDEARSLCAQHEQEAVRSMQEASELREEHARLAERTELLEGALDNARLSREVVVTSAQALARRDAERWEAEAHRNHSLYATALGELEAAQEMARASLEDHERRLEAATAALAAREQALNGLEQWRNDLVFRLQAPGGPRALGAVLPIARVIRKLSGTRAPASSEVRRDA